MSPQQACVSARSALQHVSATSHSTPKVCVKAATCDPNTSLPTTPLRQQRVPAQHHVTSSCKRQPKSARNHSTRSCPGGPLADSPRRIGGRASPASQTHTIHGQSNMHQADQGSASSSEATFVTAVTPSRAPPSAVVQAHSPVSGVSPRRPARAAAFLSSSSRDAPHSIAARWTADAANMAAGHLSARSCSLDSVESMATERSLLSFAAQPHPQEGNRASRQGYSSAPASARIAPGSSLGVPGQGDATSAIRRNNPAVAAVPQRRGRKHFFTRSGGDSQNTQAFVSPVATKATMPHRTQPGSEGQPLNSGMQGTLEQVFGQAAEEAAGAPSWHASGFRKRLFPSQAACTSQEAPERMSRMRVPPGQTIHPTPYALSVVLDHTDNSLDGANTQLHPFWAGKAGLPTCREPLWRKKQQSTSEVFLTRRCASEPGTPRSADNHCQSGRRTFGCFPTALFGGDPAEVDSRCNPDFAQRFEGAAGLRTLSQLSDGVRSNCASKWEACSADSQNSPREGRDEPLFEGSAGMRTWRQRKHLQEADETDLRFYGVRCLPEQNSCTTPADEKDGCLFGTGRNLRRQYPGARLGEWNYDGGLFTHVSPENNLAAEIPGYTELFHDTAGSRSWEESREMRQFKNRGKQGRAHQSSQDLVLTMGTSSQTPGDSAVSTPRPRVCRQASDGGDMTFANKHEVLDDFKTRFEGLAGLSTWAARTDDSSRKCCAAANDEAGLAAGTPSKRGEELWHHGRRCVSLPPDSRPASEGAAGTPLPRSDWHALTRSTGRSHILPPSADDQSLPPFGIDVSNNFSLIT
mmetsp:Transcript_71565/g.141950  ORF Transcript_71565/g.141950 Transcript_71565/m.141950 type:complete len:806 (-) Transcript_71565:273-2690(-)|eukprot:CAMPEP_0172806064 /NCGR_PEP_ID=MMETSP1075-20121228/6102_1 /TAXON_ID=2916 /ORGANISM="Ceratium fusus, Strain PA161109" /LENGTH=805 /DNA_ID=CAMNT_0013644795 /DNA_START=34 /DNA_END=2451 /DNA_ORIENTATION=-